MRGDYVFTRPAADDVLEIWQYLADRDSVPVADRVIQRIYAECQRVSEMPGIGHYREDLLDSRPRFWSVWSYLIVYRWQTNPIQVIALDHGARDLDAFFRRRQG